MGTVVLVVISRDGEVAPPQFLIVRNPRIHSVVDRGHRSVKEVFWVGAVSKEIGVLKINFRVELAGRMRFWILVVDPVNPKILRHSISSERLVDFQALFLESVIVGETPVVFVALSIHGFGLGRPRTSEKDVAPKLDVHEIIDREIPTAVDQP